MIIVKIVGGLGNQMMQYAFAYACAKRLNTTFKLDITAFDTYKLWPYGLHHFRITAPLASAEEIVQAKRQGIVAETDFTYSPEKVAQIQDGIYLDGYWSDYRYSIDVWPELQVLFQLAAELPDELQPLLSLLDQENSVALHVRRGDYVTNPNCFLLPRQYYDDAVKAVLSVQPDAHIYCFSDDPEWVKNHLRFDAPMTVVEGQDISHGFIDMNLMSRARHHIVANSTFSIWSARLAKRQGMIAIPDVFFRKDDPWLLATYGQVIQPAYPENWTMIKITADGRDEMIADIHNKISDIAGGQQRSKLIRVGVSGFYQEFYQNNYIFTHPDAPIGFELLKPFNLLHDYGKENGIEFITLDLVDDVSGLNAVLFFDLPNMSLPKIRQAMEQVNTRYLCILECELIKRDNWLSQVHQLFTRVFTWHDDLVDHVRYLKINFVTDLLPWISKVAAEKGVPVSGEHYERKLICNISGNKMVSHPNELYSKRLEFIAWYERNQPHDFDLFGVGWEAAKHPCYQGAVDDKLAVLANYRFAICFENAKNIPGYITEKLIDCFKAGVVPVYMGAPNISDWVPQDCYILADDFASPAELHAFLTRMSKETYLGYLERIQAFWLSGKSYPFSADAFINTLTSTIVKDTLTPAEQPDVSVIIPNYNHGEFLPAAITSALQSNLKVEVVVLDNASTDDSWERIQIFADHPSVRLVRNRWNIGVQHNWNHMMQVATGRYVVLLSADDLLMPSHLENAVQLLDLHPETALYYTPCLWINERDEPLGVMNHPGHLSADYIGGRNEVVGMLSYDSYITPSAAVMRRSVLSKVGSLDIHLKGAFDWDLWIRLAESSPDFIFSKRATVCYRQHSTNGSIAFYSSTAPLEDHIRILRGVLNRAQVAISQDDKYELANLLKKRFSSYSPSVTVGLRHAYEEVIGLLTENSREMISVIIPTKDRPGLLANALESLCYQTYKDFEVIVHNDGGCEVGDVIAFFQDRLRIVYLRSPVSSGAAASRNKALKVASGTIVTYLDDDDVYLENHLQVVFDKLSSISADFVYTTAEYLFQERKQGRLVELNRECVYEKVSYSHERLLISNFIPTPTWAHRRYLIDKVGGFDETLAVFEDWDFLLKVAQHTTLVHVDEVTVEVRSDRTRDDHTLRSQSANLIQFYEKLYERYPAANTETLKQRQRFIADIVREKSGLAKIDYSYEKWRDRFAVTELQAQIHAERMMLKWPARWQFNLIMIVDKDAFDLLAKSIDALTEQLYKHWRLIIVSDQDVPDSAFEDNETLGWLTVESLDEVSVTNALNGILEAIPSDWTILLNPGDKLSSTALLQVGDHLLLDPNKTAIYTDHDYYTPEDVPFGPVLKPDFNYDLLIAEDYIAAGIFFRSEQLLMLGGFQAYPLAWHYDALLRMTEMFGSQSIGHVASLVISCPDKPISSQLKNASLQVSITNHLERTKPAASTAVLSGYVDGTFQVLYEHERQPLVSIIIPTRNKVEFLQPCLDSLFRKTDYANFEVVIVDNRSTDPDVITLYEELDAQYGGRVNRIDGGEIFNFAELCNRGADSAKGEYLLFLNNDTEIIQEQWLSRMLEHAQRKEVGVVGAKLLYPESGKLQSAGVLLGAGADGVSQALYDGELVGTDVPLNRTKVVQNLSAVSAACLMIDKRLYEQVGGMDSEQFGVLYADLDLCLRVRQLGKSIVWTPFANLVHHAGKSINSIQDSVVQQSLRTVIESNRHNFQQKWLINLANDTASHRLFDKRLGNQVLDKTFAPGWDDVPATRPRLMALPLNGGSGEYRVRLPLRALGKSSLAECSVHHTSSSGRLPLPSELARNNPDTLIVQNAIAISYERSLKSYGEYLPSVFRVQMLDDLLSDIPKDSSMHKHFQRHWRDAKTRLRNVLKYCDRLIVSTEPLKAFASDMIDDIVVMPNMLERSIWGGLKSLRRAGRKPRVGWVGAQQHGGDLSLISEVVKATAAEVEWVFQGMCPEDMRPYVAEWNTDWLNYDQYPEAIAKLNLDLAVAPLELNAFNEAKSNLRLLEYGALGWPVICTDIYPYRENNPPVCRLPNDPQEWIKAIREHVSDLQATSKRGDLLKVWVHRNYMVEDHAQAWLKALTR